MIGSKTYIPRKGFNFDNYQRNLYLLSKDIALPPTISTGTTIVGVIYENGVCIAADTRATMGPIVADKNCKKLHKISSRIWAAGAGIAGDIDFVTSYISSQIELHALYTKRQPRVITALTMMRQYLFKYQGYVGAYLIVAGADPTGLHLFTVSAHGSTDKLPFVTMGSGSLAAMSVLETKYKPNMSRQEAIDLCKDAILAGIFNDLGSGSNVDIVVIEKEKTQYLRNYLKPNERAPKERSYKFERGTTAVIKKDIKKYVTTVDINDEMEIDE
ncbi:hypothetical protein PNEG_02388 [Pneumocystis murina B123]|uniref:Proteasome subunit beta n=1 Tax=Pneumocystis murina (strain B123) TaxID=1069680 RepID=M7NQR3_PNEMU|nr:hypothetical protein PNEG_02388 [Pneumocystis murina B123]EMR09446.1 hypothetical protein PNEG_02388 [Pneumocystis murina B123]